MENLSVSKSLNELIEDFFLRTYNAWKAGQAMDINANSLEFVSGKSLNEFITEINIGSRNSISIIAEKAGILENEIFLDACNSSMLITNKRLFLSKVNKMSEEFDVYNFQDIESIKSSGLMSIKGTVSLKSGEKIEYKEMEGFPGKNIVKLLTTNSGIGQNTSNLSSDTNLNEGDLPWRCPSCDSFTLIPADKNICPKCGKINKGFEIKIDETLKNYVDIKGFEKDIVSNEFPFTSEMQVRNSTGPKREWKKIIEFAKGTDLEKFITPVWTKAKKFALYGAMIGILLKALDTTTLFFAINETAGFIWLLAIGGILLSKWIKYSSWIAIGAVLYISYKVGFTGNIYMTILTVMAFGTIIGYPSGLIVGTIVGYIMNKKNLHLSDLKTETHAVLIKGIVLPAIFLATVTTLYLLWLLPLLTEFLGIS